MNIEKLMSVFVIFLVILIPVYSAEAHAFGVAVTKSSGKKYQGYFDGQGDEWIIEVNANADGVEVRPEMLTIVSGNEQEFDSCSAYAGNYLCRWSSGFATAAEKEYSADIELYDRITGNKATDTATITVDRNNPEIEYFNAQQQETKVTMQYRVNDGNEETSSGLKKIEFYDGGMLLKTITEFDSRTEDAGTVEIELDSEGLFDQIITMRAYDNLEHEAEQESNQGQAFELDLKKPIIDKDSFMIGSSTEYLPSSQKPVNLRVEIEEENDLTEVYIDLSSFGLSSRIQADRCINISDDVYECAWLNQRLEYRGSASVTISAVDEFGNVGKKTIDRTYKSDDEKPQVEFFGTGAYFNEKSYIELEAINRISLLLRDEDSGISGQDIAADFKNVGTSEYRKIMSPDNCTETEPGLWNCTWDIRIAKAGPVFLTQVKDSAGNKFSSDELFKASTTLHTDTSSPRIDSIEIISLGNTYQESRDYIQSGDYLRIILNATDNVAIRAFADFSEAALNSAQDIEAQCEKHNKSWTCVWESPQIRDGYRSGVDIDFRVEDYSGNYAETTEEIEILKADYVNVNPDYWIVEGAESIPEALDRQTTNIRGQRVYFELDLEGSQGSELINSEVVSCTGDTDYIDRYYSYGEYIVLEFKEFDSEETEKLEYNCSINLFTKKGRSSTYYPEEENVELEVEFYEFGLGEAGDVLAEKIKDEKKKIKENFNVIKYLNEILHWSRYLCNVLYTLDGVRKVWDLVNGNMESLRATAFGKPAAIAGCEGIQNAEEQVWFSSWETLHKFCKFATCKHDYGADVFNNAYQKISGFTALGMEPDKYDSLVAAIGTLCVPAIIHNIEKYRQIQCRYVYCLEEEMPAGETDTKACRELRDYQECKYIYGNLFQLIPFVGPINQALNIVKRMLSDPIAVFRAGAVWTCASYCPFSNKATVTCDVVASLVFLMDFYQDISSLYMQGKSINKDYCSEVGL